MTITDYEKLDELCWQVLADKNLNGNINYENRLKEELKEIKKQEEAKYFLLLMERGIKSNKNENNLVVPWLLDICEAPNIEKSASYTDAEWPDIDCDYLPVIREYLKDKWVPEKYGSQYVCNISNYSTFGLKSSLLDVARVLGEERNEVIAITKKLGVKDEDGDPLTWDTAQAIYKDLSDYLNSHPRLADITKNLVCSQIDWGKFGVVNPPHRKRNMGMHASGLVISGVALQDYVPMVVPSGSRELGLRASAWVEGLADTDLSSVGFIKFDFLSLEANAKIAECNKLIMDRHGIDKVCAYPGMSTWSDTSYLNDPKALALANVGDLKGIFQFDSEGIRKLVVSMKVDSFDDLVAATSIYRPGPLEALMHDEYCDRKHGRKKYDIPNFDKDLYNSLKSTYGVLCVHENTLVSMSDGSELPINKIKFGDKVHSVNENTKKVEVKECHGCAPTVFGDGVEVCLYNGYKVTVTSDHKLLTYYGMKRADELNKEDLITVVNLGDLRFYKIKSITPVKNQQFYSMSVSDNHNFIANGIVVSNCYQEQLMLYLNKVGNIPLHQCQGVIKAISKKKIEKFAKYKSDFIKNIQKIINVDEKIAIEKWKEIEGWSSYGFNRSVLNTTLIPAVYCGEIIYKEIQNFISGDIVLCVDENGETVETKVVSLHDHGVLEGYEVIFDDGYQVVCTMDHKFLTEDGQKSLREIINDNYSILCDSKWDVKYARKKKRRLDITLWKSISESESSRTACQRMYQLFREEIYNWRMESKMWTEIQNQNKGQQASATMYGLQEIVLENVGNRWSVNCYSTCSKVWYCIEYMVRKRESSEKLQSMRRDQTQQYQGKKFEDQSIRRTSVSGKSHGSINICQTRNSSSKSGKVTYLEGSQSGETCRILKGSMEITKGIENGKMVENAAKMGYGKNTLWRHTKASRFCEEQYLDRSRWILSFQGKSAQKRNTVICCTKTRSHVEHRSNSQKKDYASSFKYGMFCKFNRGDEIRLVGDVSEHAKISNTRRLVSRKIVRVVPMGKRQMYDLEVANPTHNFILPTGIITSNSHATAYTVISARQLWQKAYYPIEFYTEDLAHLKTADDRIIVYIDDAKKHGIKVNRLHLNYSDVNFSILDKDKKRNQKFSVGDEIYFGFNKIKGIGEEAAARIVAGQPYSGFVDFLNRFGTEAKVVQPLIALRVFNDAEPIKLYKFYEVFKDKKKKEDDRARRFNDSLDKYNTKLKELVPQLSWLTFDEVSFSKARQYVDVAKWIEMQQLKKKYDKCISTFNKKTIEAQERYQDLDFNKFDYDSIVVENEVSELINNKEECELYYYGFKWDHPLTLCENYKGFTWEAATLNLDNTPKVLPVEVLIKSAELAKTKNGKNMLKMRCEDASGAVVTVTAWNEEYDRFKDDLVVGACVRLRIKIDKSKDGDNYWYNLESFFWNEKNKIPKDKKNDSRVFVLKKVV